MQFSDVSKSTQAFPLPVELDMYILSFVRHNEYGSNDAWATLLSYSTTCHRFRSLALPRLFAHFRAIRSPGQTGLKNFCQLWASGDEAAKRCTGHVRSCLLNHGLSSLGLDDEHRIWSSLVALPNLTSLDVLFTSVDLTALERVLKATRIEKLRFTGDAIPCGVSEKDFGDEFCRVVSTYATSLRSLRFARSDLWINLKTLSQANLQLERFSVQALYSAPMDISMLQQFLSATPSITTLELSDKVCNPNYLSGLTLLDLPRLHTLTCPVSCVPLFIVGSRPISSLQLDSKPEPAITSADIAGFVDALSRSAGTIRQLKRLPLSLATSAWGVHTPHLEMISVIISEEDCPIFDLHAPWSMQQEIARLLNGIGGKMDNDNDDKPPFLWKNLFKFEVQPENLGQSRLVQREVEDYSINLQQQRTDVLVLAKRFPSLLIVRLGFYTNWTRPVDAPDEWKIRVIESRRRAFEGVVEESYTGSDTPWRQRDYDGVLAGILKS